jgi:hypothetical protein
VRSLRVRAADHEQYEITVDLDSFVPWLRGHRGDLVESLADEIMFMRRLSAGDEAQGLGDRTQSEMLAVTHDEVLRWRREVETIDGLLERLDCAGRVG